MATYVLVHGAWHGAWVWDKLRAELEKRGHDSRAMDMPVSDGKATWEVWADAIQAGMEGLTEPPILVGHSLSGMAIPIVASRVPVDTLVFVAAVVPNLHGEQWGDNPEPAAPGTFQAIEEHPDGSTTWTDFDNAVFTMYEDWDRGEAAAGYRRLRPQNSSSLWDRPLPADRVAGQQEGLHLLHERPRHRARVLPLRRPSAPRRRAPRVPRRPFAVPVQARGVRRFPPQRNVIAIPAPSHSL